MQIFKAMSGACREKKSISQQNYECFLHLKTVFKYACVNVAKNKTQALCMASLKKTRDPVVCVQNVIGCFFVCSVLQRLISFAETAACAAL